MNILVVLPRFPYPLEKGDKLRAFHQIRCLSQRHQVSLFCVSHKHIEDHDLEKLKPFVEHLKVVQIPRRIAAKNLARNFIKAKSVQLGYWDSSSARKEYKVFEQLVNPDVVYSQMVRTMPLVIHSSKPKVMDYQDALSLNMERRMRQERHNSIHYRAFHYEFKMLRAMEHEAFRIFDDLTIISEPDSIAIPHRMNHQIHIVPNGVDFDFFHPMPEVKKEYEVVFCGNMQYAPNVEASSFLANKVMPYVWKELPEARLLLAGATPSLSVRKLANSRVVVSGTVSDIRQSYASGHVFVAPMHLGSGLQNKLLEAMAMNIPCVTSPLANRSLQAVDGEAILVADNAEQTAQHILTLLRNKDLAQSLVDKADQFVHNRFSWENFSIQLEQILINATLRHNEKTR